MACRFESDLGDQITTQQAGGGLLGTLVAELILAVVVSGSIGGTDLIFDGYETTKLRDCSSAG